MGCHALLQGIFLTQRLNPRLFCLLHWQAGSLPLSYQDNEITQELSRQKDSGEQSKPCSVREISVEDFEGAPLEVC